MDTCENKQQPGLEVLYKIAKSKGFIKRRGIE